MTQAAWTLYLQTTSTTAFHLENTTGSKRFIWLTVLDKSAKVATSVFSRHEVNKAVVSIWDLGLSGRVVCVAKAAVM